MDQPNQPTRGGGGGQRNGRGGRHRKRNPAGRGRRTSESVRAPLGPRATNTDMTARSRRQQQLDRPIPPHQYRLIAPRASNTPNSQASTVPTLVPLPPDHPLMVEMREFKATKAQRQLYWMGLAKDLGDEWENPAGYDNQRWKAEMELADEKLAELSGQIKLAELGIFVPSTALESARVAVDAFNRQPAGALPSNLRQRQGKYSNISQQETVIWTEEKKASAVNDWMKEMGVTAAKPVDEPYEPLFFSDDEGNGGPMLHDSKDSAMEARDFNNMTVKDFEEQHSATSARTTHGLHQAHDKMSFGWSAGDSAAVAPGWGSRKSQRTHSVHASLGRDTAMVDAAQEPASIEQQYVADPRLRRTKQVLDDSRSSVVTKNMSSSSKGLSVIAEDDNGDPQPRIVVDWDTPARRKADDGPRAQPEEDIFEALLAKLDNRSHSTPSLAPSPPPQNPGVFPVPPVPSMLDNQALAIEALKRLQPRGLSSVVETANMLASGTVDQSHHSSLGHTTDVEMQDFVESEQEDTGHRKPESSGTKKGGRVLRESSALDTQMRLDTSPRLPRMTVRERQSIRYDNNNEVSSLPVRSMNRNVAKAHTSLEGRVLYVGNLAFDVREEDLRNLFPDSQIESVIIPMDPNYGRPYGHAYVVMSTLLDADLGLEGSYGQKIRNRNAMVRQGRLPQKYRGQEIAPVASGGKPDVTFDEKSSTQREDAKHSAAEIINVLPETSSVASRLRSRTKRSVAEVTKAQNVGAKEKTVTKPVSTSADSAKKDKKRGPPSPDNPVATRQTSSSNVPTSKPPKATRLMAGRDLNDKVIEALTNNMPLSERKLTRRQRREMIPDLENRLRQVEEFKAARQQGRQLHREEMRLVNREEDITDMLAELRDMD